MKLKFIFSVLFYSILQVTVAQDYLGYVNSNYSGITGAIINPANIADNRMRVDVSLVGINLNIANNYLGIKHGAFKSLMNSGQDSGKFAGLQKSYLVQVDNNKDKGFFISNRISLPSFMITLNSKSAIGFSANMRNYFALDGLSEPLAKLLYSDIGRNQNFDVSGLLGKTLQNKQLSLNMMSWMEYGITYGRVIIGKGKHFLKVGITPKLLQGLSSAFLNVRDFQFRFDNDPVQIQNDSLQVLALIHTRVNYSHSSNLDQYNKGFNPNFSNFSYLGLGLDVGLVYEWRPKFDDYIYNMDGKSDLYMRDQNKYKLKVGLSLVDLGSIKYDRGKYSRDFSMDINGLKYRLIDLKQLPVFNFDRAIDSLGVTKSTPKTYRMATPAALSMQVDYLLSKNIYLNFTPYYAFQMKNRDAKVHDVTVLSLTPRIEHRWFGISLPISYNSFYARARQPVKVGTMLRLGPLAFGTNDVTSYFGGNFFGANFYFLAKVPIPYGKVRDDDHDGVSNRKDLCRDQSGTWEFRGCPDRDFDHVPDAGDKCPDVPGLAIFFGCPDSDMDSIPDAEDQCPNEKGLKIYNGCPDSDNDSVPDKLDACPFTHGLKELNGCPDSDGDGVADPDDACPSVFGFKELRGCPDRDLDSIADIDDYCPEQAGPKENNGCPWPDEDRDGIFDKDDACPTVAGIAELKGCPEQKINSVADLAAVNSQTVQMAVAEKKIIDKAFKSLEFASARDVIKATSFKGLEELAKLLTSHQKDWKIKLTGHTDNEGSAQKNMLLSEKRAKAVAAFLISKGVSADQIITEWHGQEQPIADNRTAAGKQKNRRVEMKIVLVEK